MIKAAENKDSHPKLPKTMQHFLKVTTAALKKKKKIPLSIQPNGCILYIPNYLPHHLCVLCF